MILPTRDGKSRKRIILAKIETALILPTRDGKKLKIDFPNTPFPNALILPTRDGKLQRLVQRTLCVPRFDPTYKGWKASIHTNGPEEGVKL